MRCWHFGLRRKLIPYLEGTIPTHEVKRLEKHLRDCGYCRDMFVRLRTGHQFAQQLRPFRPKGDPDASDFGAMMPEIGEMVRGRNRWAQIWERWCDALATPQVVQLLIALLVVQLAI